MESYSQSLQDLINILGHLYIEKLEKERKKMKSNQFIIGSLQEGDTHVSLSHNPMPHDNKVTAGREAERLARLSPGKRYVVLQVVGVVEAQALVWK